MSKYAGIVIGAVIAILGIGMFFRWSYAFAIVIKGTLPVALIFAGIIAVIAGISEILDESAHKKEKKK